MQMKKVVIIDDDEDFLMELNEMLKLSYYETVTESDSLKAFDLIKKEKPDIVLLDLNMDKKNGYQVAQQINDCNDTKDIPIIAMTGYFTTAEHKLLMRLNGLKNCLLKPIHPLDVIAKIEWFAK